MSFIVCKLVLDMYMYMYLYSPLSNSFLSSFSLSHLFSLSLSLSLSVGVGMAIGMGWQMGEARAGSLSSIRTGRGPQLTLWSLPSHLSDHSHCCGKGGGTSTPNDIDVDKDLFI